MYQIFPNFIAWVFWNNAVITPITVIQDSFFHGADAVKETKLHWREADWRGSRDICLLLFCCFEIGPRQVWKKPKQSNNLRNFSLARTSRPELYKAIAFDISFIIDSAQIQQDRFKVAVTTGSGGNFIFCRHAFLIIRGHAGKYAHDLAFAQFAASLSPSPSQRCFNE